MKISTKGRYALRYMVDLARNSTGEAKNIALHDISERQGISVKYLEQIVSKLCKEGLVVSSRGPQGGYRLSKSPAQYTAGEILRAIEGDMAPVACLVGHESGCDRRENCSTLKFWVGLDDAITQYVDRVTLAELLLDDESDGCHTD